MTSPKQDQNYRFERKFLIEELDAAQVGALIKLHPSMFSRSYPSRYVNNIYLDTPILDNYADNVNGLSGRLKARIRWYGELFGTIESPALEIKAKRGQVGSKHKFPLPGFTVESGFSSDQMVRLFRDAHDLPGWVQLRIATLSVVIVNRYKRAYFVSLDGRFRVTLDSEMTSYRADNLDVRFRDRQVNRKQVVLELKYPPECDREADRITSALPFRVTRSSKYVQAIDHVVVD